MLLPCPKCGRFFKVKTIGVTFEEGMPVTSSSGAIRWEPYKLWAGDLYECEGCGAQVIAGVGQGPIAEHFQPDYAEKVTRHAPLCRVKDMTGPYRGPVA
jgi:hypothetical protein